MHSLSSSLSDLVSENFDKIGVRAYESWPHERAPTDQPTIQPNTELWNNKTFKLSIIEMD